jgi:hypothetical protein
MSEGIATVRSRELPQVRIPRLADKVQSKSHCSHRRYHGALYTLSNSIHGDDVEAINLSGTQTILWPIKCIGSNCMTCHGSIRISHLNNDRHCR